MIDRFIESFRRQRALNRTCRELSQLSDRELRDIGLSRAGIRTAAERAIL